MQQLDSPETLLLRTEPARLERKRHSRKYMEGNLGRTRSFYFRGRAGQLKLRAHNLQLFLPAQEVIPEAGLPESATDAVAPSCTLSPSS